MSKCFVYGTLKPGDVNWSALAPYCSGKPIPDTIRGTLYDTGWSWPAAVVDENAERQIPGFTVHLCRDMEEEALEVLDRIEGTPTLFERSTTTTGNGNDVWVYHWPHETIGFDQIEAWTSPPPF